MDKEPAETPPLSDTVQRAMTSHCDLLEYVEQLEQRVDKLATIARQMQNLVVDNTQRAGEGRRALIEHLYELWPEEPPF